MSRRRKWVFFLAGIMVVVCCGAAAYVGYYAYSIVSMMAPVSCDEFTNDYLKVSLPASATIVDETCSDFLGDSYDVTFTMSPDDLGDFQQQAPVAAVESWASDSSNSYFSEESWQADREALQREGAQLESLLYGWYGDGAIVLRVLIDVSDETQTFVIYSVSNVD